uniref:Aldehyde oxidase 3-like n=1 Tax=Sinocyclocheilus grahami TaxID=75366 RepID=A0A672N566_SINGR
NDGQFIFSCCFYVKIVEKNADPEEMLLAYLRRKVNACLQPICSLHGAAVVTIEGIGSTKTKLHPVQERIAKAHGSQCGFCTPGMVMSMYTLLRNNPQPTMEDIRETLGGNLCRCTGYRPIIDGFKTFCDVRTATNFCYMPSFLQIMRKQKAEQLCFQGEKARWISPADLKDLIKLKAEYSNAPLLVGNTTIGWFQEMNLKGTVHPLVIYGGSVTVGAGCSLSVLKDILLRGTEELGPEKSRVYQALVQTLQCLAGKQIRNMLVPETQSSSDPVGRPNVHQAALQQATGEAVYYDDIPSVKGELFVSMVTSTRAHAKIIFIDASVALAMSGVITFISAKDVPGQNRRLWFNNPEELFAEEEVICVGQIIGAIVAETREQAKRAAEQVAITYQDIQPAFFTIEEAIEHQSFFDPKRKLERGNVEEGFEKADHILEDELYMGGQEHFYMETQGLIAIPKAEAGEMELYVASQHAAYTQEVVGITLGIDSNKITCHVKRLGGGFGGKVMKIASLSAIAATAAYKTDRAVRCVLERGDDMLITSGRSPFLGKYKVGYMNDGTILAADITYYSNGGCTLDESSFIMEKALLHMDNGYKIPNLRGHGLVCKTNLPSYTAFRGFGGPQGLTIIEGVLHEVAARCGLPAHQVRDINMYKDEKCYTHHKQLFSPRDMVRCWNECLEKSDYTHRCLSIEQFNAHNHWKKRGISIVPLKFGIGFSKGFYNQGAALVNIYKDGSVLISHGGTEMGQGINTKAIQIASRILKVPMSSIHIKETCTGNVPNAAPSAASFGTDAVGMSVKNGCEKLMRRLEPLIKKHPQYTWQQLVVEAYCQKISLSATGFFMYSEGNAYYYFTFGACCSEVEIDCLTGDHKNIRTDIVMDVGRSINPALDVGQVEGGFVQGIGLYTIEELQFSPEGVLLTRGPSQYKIPALCDVPPQLNVHLLRNADNPHAIYSSKGIGEPPVFFGCTLFFAIKEAIAAARRERGLSDSFPFSSPATAEKIRMACEDCFTRMVGEQC